MARRKFSKGYRLFLFLYLKDARNHWNDLRGVSLFYKVNDDKIGTLVGHRLLSSLVVVDQTEGLLIRQALTDFMKILSMPAFVTQIKILNLSYICSHIGFGHSLG